MTSGGGVDGGLVVCLGAKIGFSTKIMFVQTIMVLKSDIGSRNKYFKNNSC